MCNRACIDFGVKNIKKEDIENKDIIEIGSYNINGSLKNHIISLRPKKYTGIDMKNGPCVDIVCNAYDILDKFGKESFDFVLSTELMEHVEDWRKVIHNFKSICRPNGIIMITTRSKGFGKHDYPSDYWRYEVEDLKQIFEDFIIETLVKDSDRSPGVFISARKPEIFAEKDLSKIELYRII